VHSPELLLKKLGWWAQKNVKSLKSFENLLAAIRLSPVFGPRARHQSGRGLVFMGCFLLCHSFFLLREERQTHMLAEWVHRAKSPVGYANIFLIFRFAFPTFLLGRLDSRLFSNSLGSKVVIISCKRVILPRVCLWVFCVISQDAWELRALWLH